MRQLTLTAVAVWLGAMGFFAFIAAPAAFGALDREAAGRFVSVVFPRYYGVGLALGLVACFGLGVRWMGGAWRGLDWTVAGLVLLMLALTLYAGAVVLPAAHFARLHRLSSILNVIVMLSGILVVVIETVRRR